MKKASIILSLILCLFGCHSTNRYGIDFSDGKLIEKSDSHGGFHGDGILLELWKFDNNIEDSLIEYGWSPLPIDENLRKVLNFSFDTEKLEELLNNKEGYYYFEDRHCEYVEGEDYTDIIKRYSFNYTFVLYTDQQVVVVEVDS